MNTSKKTISVEAKYSDDNQHRYLLRKVWNKELPEVTVIMINPTCEDELTQDLTSILVQNNVSKYGFGGVSIVNLYSRITPKIIVRWNSDKELIGDDNDKEILKAAERSETIVIAWGSYGHNNKRVAIRKESVLKMLKKHREKFRCIADDDGRVGLHPLTPSVRSAWKLVTIGDDLYGSI